MVNKTCSWGVCNSDSRRKDHEDMKGVTFKRFPQPKTQPERCMEWIRRCNRPQSELHIGKIGHYHFVCSKHFSDGAADPLSASNGTRKLMIRKRRSKKHPTATPAKQLCSGIISTYHEENNGQPDQHHKTVLVPDHIPSVVYESLPVDPLKHDHGHAKKGQKRKVDHEAVPVLLLQATSSGIVTTASASKPKGAEDCSGTESSGVEEETVGPLRQAYKRWKMSTSSDPGVQADKVKHDLALLGSRPSHTDTYMSREKMHLGHSGEENSEDSSVSFVQELEKERGEQLLRSGNKDLSLSEKIQNSSKETACVHYKDMDEVSIKLECMDEDSNDGSHFDKVLNEEQLGKRKEHAPSYIQYVNENVHSTSRLSHTRNTVDGGIPTVKEEVSEFEQIDFEETDRHENHPYAHHHVDSSVIHESRQKYPSEEHFLEHGNSERVGTQNFKYFDMDENVIYNAPLTVLDELTSNQLKVLLRVFRKEIKRLRSRCLNDEWTREWQVAKVDSAHPAPDSDFHSPYSTKHPVPKSLNSQPTDNLYVFACGHVCSVCNSETTLSRVQSSYGSVAPRVHLIPAPEQETLCVSAGKSERGNVQLVSEQEDDGSMIIDNHDDDRKNGILPTQFCALDMRVENIDVLPSKNNRKSDECHPAGVTDKHLQDVAPMEPDRKGEHLVTQASEVHQHLPDNQSVPSTCNLPSFSQLLTPNKFSCRPTSPSSSLCSTSDSSEYFSYRYTDNVAPLKPSHLLLNFLKSKKFYTIPMPGKCSFADVSHLKSDKSVHFGDRPTKNRDVKDITNRIKKLEEISKSSSKIKYTGYNIVVGTLDSQESPLFCLTKVDAARFSSFTLKKS